MPVGWLNGIQVEAEQCVGNTDVPGGYWWPECNGDTAPAGTKAVPPDRNPYYVWQPYQVVEADGCSPMEPIADAQARATRALIANQSRKMELELWSGRAAHAGGFQLTPASSPDGNNWLANPDTAVEIGTVPLAYALGELVQYLADATTEQGMIHAQPRVVSAWWSAQLLRREGNIIYENTADHIIVPGQGYTGMSVDASSDAGDAESGGAGSASTSTAYATTMVSVAEDTITPLGADAYSGLNRDTNAVDVKSERAVMAWWDNCAHGAVDVDLANPCGSAS